MDSSFNILLTCAGGPAAVSVIKSLRCSKFKDTIKIVATDQDPLSAGMQLADRNYITPNVDLPNWWDTIESIIKQENINVILQTGDVDILQFAQHKRDLTRLGVFNLIPAASTIRICQDKYVFYSLCKQVYKLPYTSKSDTPPGARNRIIKPNRGSGSTGIQLIDSPVSVKVDDGYIIQTLLPGKEISVDILCDSGSNTLNAVIRERIQTKAGISTKGKIIKDSSVLLECINICKYLNIIGPACIQLKQDENNEYKFIEINPRFGGGLYFSTLAGVNIPEMMLELFSDQQVTINEPKEITVVRYFEEIII